MHLLNAFNIFRKFNKKIILFAKLYPKVQKQIFSTSFKEIDFKNRIGSYISEYTIHGI